MLSNAYFLAKFRFDTAENEPAKNLQNFRKMHFRKMHFRKMHACVGCGRVQVAEPVDPPGQRRPPPVLDDHRGVLPASWSHQRPDHYNGSEELFIGILTGFIIIDIT